MANANMHGSYLASLQRQAASKASKALANTNANGAASVATSYVQQVGKYFVATSNGQHWPYIAPPVPAASTPVQNPRRASKCVVRPMA